ncbi:MAG TPA: nuclear transport factor 2 family protein [Gammaproteobacteria bacterium]|nr:nuclear transport factor 2 family protein [Gammaproteobacteria bacterium]
MIRQSLFVDDDPVLHRNKQAALRIMRELLQCNQWDRAGEWLTERYIQHNPNAESGLAGVVYYFTEVLGREPTATCDELTTPVVAVMAEDDLVTVILPREYDHPTNEGESYTTTWFDTWRFVDGKADEHWDPAQIPAP